jgi:uncharacterized phage protein gp47/JayE
MSFTGNELYRTQAQVLQAMILALQNRISDAWVGPDGVTRILFEIEAGQFENAYLANQLVLEDMFVQTASIAGLQRFGIMYGLEQKGGTPSQGNLLFTGSGGTFIPVGAEVAYDPGGAAEDVFYYTTTQSGSIPNPGIPAAATATNEVPPSAAPTAAINATAGNLNGSYYYRVSFVDPVGETLASPATPAVSPVNQQVNLTNIPVGAAGVTARNIYRQKSPASTWKRVTTIANNTATTYTDNTADGSVGSQDAILAANPTGTLEYTVTFLTTQGETTQAPDSSPVIASNAAQVNITSIPLGGVGTTGRKLYRSKNGGVYQYVAQISDNTTTSYKDNIADGALGLAPPDDSTAERVLVAGASEEPGTRFNVVPGAVTVLSNVPDGITDVNNPGSFTGGTDTETTESYRTRLLDWIRNPQSGSAEDLRGWALTVDGVAIANVFTNDNLGTPTNGHATIRVAGPGGATPIQAVLDEVLALLNLHDLANITLHVTSFTAVSTNVTVTITPATGFVLADVSTAAGDAIRDYINNSVPVGGTVYLAGIVDAVFGLSGVANVVVTTPGSDQTTAATSKRVPGTIIIN